MKKLLNSKSLQFTLVTVFFTMLAIPTSYAVPSALLSNVTVSNTSFNPGDKVEIKYSVNSTDLTSSQVNQITLIEESEPDDCGSRCSLSVRPKLVSGTISAGNWYAEFYIPKNFYGGKYNLVVGYVKLNNGSLKIIPITISGPPIPRPVIPTANITSYKLNKTDFVSGEKVILDFQVKTQDLPSGSIVPVARIVDENESDDCENYCSMSVKPVLLKGSALEGSWRATFALSKNFYGGNYYLIFGYIKIRGESFKSIPIQVDGPPAPEKPLEAFIDDLFYDITQMKVTSAQVSPGGTVTGTFRLDTNDPTVRSPECIVTGATDWSDAVRVDGDYMSGTWKCSVTIPAKMLLGKYTLHTAVVGSANNEKNETHEDLGEFSVVAKTPTPVNKSSSNSLKSTSSASILCFKSGTFKYFPKAKTCPEGWIKK